MAVAHRCLLFIDMENRITEIVYCNIIEMRWVYILLGRPFLYDREAVHFAKANTYTVVVNGKQHKPSPMASNTDIHPGDY